MKYLNSFDNIKDYTDGMLNINKTYEPSISLVNGNIIFSKNIDWMFIVNITNEELNQELKIIFDPMSQIDKVYIDNELIEFNNHNENPNLNRLKYTFDELGNHVIMIKFIDSIRTDIPIGGILFNSLLDHEILVCVTECTIFRRHAQYQWNGATKLKKVNLKFFDTGIDLTSLGGTSLFQGATNIKEIYFPKSIKYIPNNTVYGLNNIEKWNLSELNNLETIDYNGLSGTHVSEIILPKNVKTLGMNAFAYSETTINKIDLGNVEEIDRPFTGCTLNNLDIVIPATVKKINYGLFGNSQIRVTGVHSIKFMNPNPINVTNGSYSEMMADAEIIYVPKGSKMAYVNSGYCTSGYAGVNADETIESAAQHARNSYLQDHPLLEESDENQQYNENILAQADIEADSVRQQLRTQYGYDRIVEFDL
jgi:hypothetical protein